LERAEAERLAAEAEARSEAERRAEALKQLDLEQAKTREAVNAAQRRADEDVSAARAQMLKEIEALREEQDRIMAEARPPENCRSIGWRRMRALPQMCEKRLRA
jgi:hypothetical protein